MSVERAPVAASYMSRLVSERFATGRPLDSPEATRSPAALLQADIVGFTRSVEQITEAGPDGLDDLAAALDAYFVVFADTVQAHGGDILNVAGDAFLCAWTATESLADATIRAADAASAVLDALRTSPLASRFSTRIGIGAGDLITAFVGGWEGNWRLVATGDLVEETSRAEQSAIPGSALLTSAAVELIADRCEVDGSGALVRVLDAPRPVAAPARPPVPIDTLLPMVPVAVRGRQPRDGSSWLAELRRVTVVIAGLSAVDHVDRVSLDVGHTVVRSFQAAIARFEGFTTVALDNKGITMLGFFGLPPLAHEDDASRAVLAAQRIAGEMEGLDVEFGVGIAQGRAFAGAFGNHHRCEYTVHGNVVNLASRLMTTATNEILVDEDTAHAVRGDFELEARQPVMVKGRSEPVIPSVPGRRVEVTAISAAAPHSLVGRTAERRLVVDHISGNGGGPLVVEGDAGIGKSVLLADAVGDALRRGTTVLTVAAAEVERATSYFPWRPVISRLVASEHLASFIAEHPDSVRLLPLLRDLVDTEIASTLDDDNELTGQMRGEVRAENTRRLVTALVRHTASASPTALVVEDGHWLDSPSWTMLADIIEQVPELRVVIATRPSDGDRPAALDAVLSRPSTTHLVLTPLGNDHVESLLCRRLGVDGVPTELTAFVGTRAVGNPFFCVELVQTMRESGVIEVSGTSCTVRDLHEIDVPTTIEEVVVSRLDRLSEAERIALKVAAVIGRSFGTSAVRALVSETVEVDDLDAGLRHLESIGLTVRTEDGDGRFAFSHDIIREVTYGLLPAAQRRPLHLAVVDWYEATFGDLDPHVATLAEHCTRAAAPARAVHYLERAGDQALRTGAFAGALDFFGRALEIDEDSPPTRRAKWVKGVGTAHYFHGDLVESRAHHEQALAAFHRPVPVGKFTLGRALAREVAIQAAHRIRPRRFLGRDAEESPRLDEAVECYRTLGQIYFLDGEAPDILIYLTLAGLNAGERSGPSTALSRILINASVAAALVNLDRLATQYADRAIAMAEAHDGGEASAYVRSIHTILLANWGRWDEARSANDIAQAMVVETGDYNVEAEIWQTRAALEICAGDFRAAETAWGHTRRLGEKADNQQMYCWSLLDECETLLGRGDPDGAAEVLELALAIPTAPNDGSTKIEKHYSTAAVRLHQERFEEAADEAAAAVEMVAEQLPSAYPWPDFCASAVEILVAIAQSESSYGREHRDELMNVARRGAKAVKKVSRQFGNVASRRWFLDGLVAAAEGRLDDARKSYAKAADVAAELDHSYDRARALVESAALGESVDLDEVSATLEDLGAGEALRRVAAVRRLHHLDVA